MCACSSKHVQHLHHVVNITRRPLPEEGAQRSEQLRPALFREDVLLLRCSRLLCLQALHCGTCNNDRVKNLLLRHTKRVNTTPLRSEPHNCTRGADGMKVPLGVCVHFHSAPSCGRLVQQLVPHFHSAPSCGRLVQQLVPQLMGLLARVVVVAKLLPVLLVQLFLQIRP